MARGVKAKVLIKARERSRQREIAKARNRLKTNRLDELEDTVKGYKERRH